MNHVVTFSVVSGGAPLAGFSTEQVGAALARALRIEPEQACQIVSSQRVLKKGITLEQAERYKQQLKRIGLAVEIRRVDPPRTSSGLTLELEPMEDEPEAETDEVAEAPESAPSTVMRCPKCDHEQPRSSQCVSCGIFFHKLETTPSPSAAEMHEERDEDVLIEDDEAEDALPSRALGAAAAAALAGALVWKLIAVAFEYELGLVAWGIGGAVGFAAAAAGSRGQRAGIACAVLVVLSILGGKYWAIETFKEQAVEMVFGVDASDGDALRPVYDEMMADARIYADEVTDEDSLRMFMVDRGYSLADDPDDVSAAELAEFDQYNRAELSALAYAPVDYEDWKTQTFEAFGDLSTSSLLWQSFGLLDILFLFFGVATAFRLGSGEGATPGAT